MPGSEISLNANVLNTERICLTTILNNFNKGEFVISREIAKFYYLVCQ